MQPRLTNLPILFTDLNLERYSHHQQAMIAKIDAVLPQTQCGLCTHPEGCLPYAHAIVTSQEAYNKCVPGGQAVTDIITQILQSGVGRESSQPVTKTIIKIPITFLPSTPIKVLPSKWATNSKTNRPQEVRAVIREDDCIGCTKCIPACPVDAIVGTGKHMHTIFTDLCTGCELCLDPCPVDCIDLVPVERSINDMERESEQTSLRERYHTHLDRVYEQIQDKHNSRPVISVVESKLSNLTSMASSHIDISERDAKYAIVTAKLRSKIKKLEKQLSVRDNNKKREELIALQQELTDTNV